MSKDISPGRQVYLTDQLLTDVDNRRGLGIQLGAAVSLLEEEGEEKTALIGAIATVLLEDGKVVRLTPREVSAFELQTQRILEGENASQRKIAQEMGISRRSLGNYTRRATRTIEQLHSSP